MARTGIAKSEVRSAVDTLIKAGSIVEAGGRLIAATPFEGLQAEAIEAIKLFHKKQPLAKGISREGLRDTAFSNVPNAIAETVIDALMRTDRIV
ncbi:MAG: DNA/RNA-binding winged helix domain-containing protein, partial [bacterium]